MICVTLISACLVIYSTIVSMQSIRHCDVAEIIYSQPYVFDLFIDFISFVENVLPVVLFGQTT